MGRAKEANRYFVALNGGERAQNRYDKETEFVNLRSEMWWQMREDIRRGDIVLPNDPELLRDLSTPTWKPQNGKVRVEPKDEIIARLKRSPNKGDAAVYWNFVRDREAIASDTKLRRPTEYQLAWMDVYELDYGDWDIPPGVAPSSFGDQLDQG